MLRIVFIVLLFPLLNCNSVSIEGSSGLNRGAFAKGALLTTDFNSFEDFKKVVTIEYSNKAKRWVRLTHSSNSGAVSSILKTGVSEADFINAKAGGLWDRMKLGFRSPYFVLNRKDLLRVYFLSRRRHKDFGWPDKAFFDLAETMKNNIYKEDLALASAGELSEKGYINTFNHVIAQALMTSLFSEDLADFVADTHERKTMPELITGNFSKEQLGDIENGVVDNYVDMINNEWGQELGKQLKGKYNLSSDTYWTSELLTNYLNDLQSYFGRVFMLRFNPFTEQDELTIHFANKINRLMDDVSGLW